MSTRFVARPGDVATPEDGEGGLGAALDAGPAPEEGGADPAPGEAPARRARPVTLSIARMSKREIERGREAYPDEGFGRPATREDCRMGDFAERPCPFVSCKHHLYLNVNERTGSIKLNFPDAEVWDLPETCALDVADRGGATLEDVAAHMNLTRERIRQLEGRGLAKLKALGEMASLSDYCDND